MDLERIEVYRFDRGVECMWARAEPVTHVERVARRLARPAAALLRELLSAPRLAAEAGGAVLAAVLRCVLGAARAALAGVAEAAADAALKPALVLTHNALARPLLACAAQAGGALREALRPLAGALGDALDPLARLLSALRLVHVHVERAPACGCPHAPHTPV